MMALYYNLGDSNVSFDVLENEVRTALQKNPKLRYYIYIEQGKTDERLPKIKNILQANGSPKIQYFSFQLEKGTDSKESLWSRIIKKTMYIK